MLEFDRKGLCIHRIMSNKYKYTIDQKLLDLISLASAPGIGSSNSIYKRIQRKIEFEKGHSLKKDDKLRQFSMNSFDEQLFNASQQNKGVLTKEAIESYAKAAFHSEGWRKTFLDYTKVRLGYLSYLGLLNDTTEGNRYYEEKITLLVGEIPREQIMKVRLDYRYEVNTAFYKCYLEYRKQKERRLKEQFEFGRVDTYIYNYIRKYHGTIDLDAIQKEKVNQAMDEAGKILNQVDLMLKLGYLHEKQLGVYQLENGIREKIEKGNIFLNPAEKKLVEFILRHSVFSLDKYMIDREVEAEGYADILKTRLDKLIALGFVMKDGNQYSFTANGENRIKAYYAETYGFTSFDRNILNNQKDGVLDLEEIRTELGTRYGGASAAQTFERQQERLFIMECAGMVHNTGDGIYTLADKSLYILEDENRIYTEEKRELLKKSFNYSESEVELYQLIQAKGGTIHPEKEIQTIMETMDPVKDIKEIDTYNMLIRNYKCLGTADIDATDEVKQNVKLGYLMQNEDGTLSLTVKGKRLVNVLNLKEDDLWYKAFKNKKFRLLNDIDKSCNRLDPKVYLKTQKVIIDKELRKTVNLLMYKPENLYLMGLLTRNDDGSYTITETYEKLSIQFYSQKNQEEIQGFKLSNVHKFILKFCKDNRFNLDTYKEYISKKLTGTSIEREMKWKKSSLEKLTRMGYFEHIDENTYGLTEKGIQTLHYVQQDDKYKKREKVIQEFKPGPGYKSLLKNEKEGILDFQDVEKRIQQYNKAIQEKELSIKKKMLQKLVAAGYLESVTGEAAKEDDSRTLYKAGLFRLTPKALAFMADKPDNEQSAEIESVSYMNSIDMITDAINGSGDNQSAETALTKNSTNDKCPVDMEIKITKFDIDNIISLSDNNFLTKAVIEQSPRYQSILKRIHTLTKAGLLLEEDRGWRLTEKLLERVKIRDTINHKREKSHSPKLDLECLSVEQKRTLTDLKDFLNLTGSQILKYIYNGSESLYKADVRYLIEKGILKKDAVYDVYVLTKKGTKLTSDLTGDHHIFGSKLDSRREEIKHDVLVFTAYKDMEKQLSSEGKVITSFKTDRVMRSEDMQKHNRMNGEYPDLRIDYEDKATGKKGFVNIEVDTGYSEKVIGQKLKIPNLRWYTNSKRQQEKVLKKARDMHVTIIREEYWR